MIDHARVVLSGIVPNRRDHLLHATQHLEADHFRSSETRKMFSLLERYYDMTGDILSGRLLADMLERQGADAAKTILYEELYAELESTEVPDHEFLYAVTALQDVRAYHLTGEAITTSFEVLENGTTIGKQDLKGHDDARTYLYGELSRIDRLSSGESSPEGDVRHEPDAIRRDYAERKARKVDQAAVQTGIRAMDLNTGGLENGELVLICAYTGEGKSMLSTQIAWNAAIDQKKNVFFATSETIRPQVRRRLLARHSRLPQFGLPDGLDSNAIKNGTLTPEQETIYEKVIDDFTQNKAYGKVHVAQVPRGATLGYVESRLNRAGALWNVDLVVIDYLALLKPDRPRNSSREEFNDILKDAKTMATSFESGRGVPVVSPWAMSQSSYKEAKRTGEYTLANLAETSEAEKSPDQLIALLRLPEQPNEVKCFFLKNRDGDLPDPFVMQTDYRSAFLGEKTTLGVESAFDEEDDEMDSMFGEATA